MAGHSKWNNIKNRKGAQDKKKAKVFGQLSKLIKVAVKEGGSGDPTANPNLRLMLDKARAANMPKDNIDRAISRGLGKSASGASMQDITYEGFGPGGVGMLITAVTDNVNRTSSEVRFALSRAGGSLGAPGSVGYMFQRQDGGEEGYVCIMPLPVTDPQQQQQLETLMDELLELEDVEEVFCAGQNQVGRALPISW